LRRRKSGRKRLKATVAVAAVAREHGGATFSAQALGHSTWFDAAAIPTHHRASVVARRHGAVERVAPTQAPLSWR